MHKQLGTADNCITKHDDSEIKMMTGGTIPRKPVLLLPQSPDGEAACSCQPGSSKTPDPACTQQTRTPASGQARPQGQRQTRGAYTTGTAASVHFLCFCPSVPPPPSFPPRLICVLLSITYLRKCTRRPIHCLLSHTHTHTHVFLLSITYLRKCTQRPIHCLLTHTHTHTHTCSSFQLLT